MSGNLVHPPDCPLNASRPRFQEASTSAFAGTQGRSIANTASSEEEEQLSIKTLHHEIEIDASPEAVWAVLADTASYPDWNPFVRTLEGELRAGAKLEVRIAPPGGRAMTFRPVVLAAEPERELRWLGRFLVPGLVDGEHRFRLEPLPNGRTRFVQEERFSGLLVRPIRKTLAKTELGFEQMNGALKRRVEAGSRAVSGPAA